MDWTDHITMCENAAFGDFLVATIASCLGLNLEEDDIIYKITRTVEKITRCGAWIVFDTEGIKVGTIVEGQHGDGYSERISIEGLEESEEGEELLSDRFWEALERCEQYSDENWPIANGEVDD